MRILLVGLLAIASVTGCKKSEKQEHGEAVEAALPTVSIDQLDTMLAKNECTPVDANGDVTRKKLGVIPGAVLLNDAGVFTPSELPADKSKQLVFYCANTNCTASHVAAQKALTAGYANVKVLPDGIAGWVKAGKHVQNI